MNLTVLAAFLYGIILLVGGIIGYAKAKSKPSLISGVVTGLLLISSAIIQLQKIAWGLTLGQITTILLIVVFVIRLLKTRKFMPAGLMLILSVAIFAILVSPT
ncbi:TMEM14 family protein [Crocosphaera sp. XPORK-15E]|uniref:TMEM14 family protein n=1 Tax=Crocosphaera sp. XPORK-15E TaxID=3110247 RepID=UPI002B2037F4|nr:TMEM14 family protein [Crocosphaera sp. XPORK-15E]MEA5534986.1 TMEM14 family protein [Crocosphaera sp. XPORK-15E]